MSDPAKLRFLPWLRAGAARAISSADTLSGVLPANATLRPWVQIAGHDAIEQTAMLRGPGHVTALGAQAIVKMEPKEGTQDFENNYFPFVELRPADLPWRFTPASPGANNQLRPWLVLVVVRQQEGVSIAAESGAKLPVLRIEAPAKPSLELPDLGDSAAWAHVQTGLPADELADALESDISAAVARLMCPRYLDPNAAWIACLVPAFDVGKHAGLGEDAATGEKALPAWDHAASDPKLDETVVRLPIYHRWTFSSGPSGDFELLARRLEPDEGGTRLGRADLDLSNPGPPLPKPQGREKVVGDFVGALRSPGVQRGDIPSAHRKWLDEKIEDLLEDTTRRLPVPAEQPAGYDPARDDPVVAPPLYGSYQADRYDVPESNDAKRGWMRALNLQPELRAIAGLGAAVVRKSQESLMASAWAQAGAFRDAQHALDQGRLAAEIGRSMARRVHGWDAGVSLQATLRVHAWVDSPASTQSLAVDLNNTAVPPALVSAGFARATRPRCAVGRRWSARQRPAALSSVTDTFLAATRPNASRVALDFAKTSLPVGAWTRDAALEADATRVLAQAGAKRRSAARSAAPRTVDAVVVGPVSGEPFKGTYADAVRLENELHDVLNAVRDVPAPLREVVDLSRAAASVIAQLDPLRSIQTGLVARIPALSGLVAADGALPSRLVLQPTFTDPLSWDLVRLDSRFMLPGADKLLDNKVALLEADDDFVAAFLAGANHEMSRELIWREFPTSPRHTFFHRFWDTDDGGPDDIGEISRWEKPRLGRNLTGVAADALTVILVRGDIVRRYPEAHVYLTAGAWQGDETLPDDARIKEPLLQGMLDQRTIFYGFRVSARDMVGNRGKRGGTPRKAEDAGWFVTVEEPSHGPRFGLDTPADDGSDLTKGAKQWRELSWGHLVRPKDTVADLHYAVARTPLPSRTVIEGRLAWGHNAAHMAAITWQRPFRLYVHADRLLATTKPGTRATPRE